MSEDRSLTKRGPFWVAKRDPVGPYLINWQRAKLLRQSVGVGLSMASFVAVTLCIIAFAAQPGFCAAGGVVLFAASGLLAKALIEGRLAFWRRH